MLYLLVLCLQWLQGLALTPPPTIAGTQPEEMGKVAWIRDLDEAVAKSRQLGRPILILFQEIPGCSTCKRYGNQVLSDPMVVETIENYFVPLCIYNNQGGKDGAALKIFHEPSWNNPVVRIVDANLKDLIPRISGEYSRYSLLGGMTRVIREKQPLLPSYLILAAEEALQDIQPVEEVFISMYCFWSGERTYGSMPGVIGTEAGFMQGKEVVRVRFLPALIRLDQLIEKGKAKGVAETLFLPVASKLQLPPGLIRVEKAGTFRQDPESKYSLQNHPVRAIPMSPIQKARVNAAIGQGQPYLDLLNPFQQQLLQTGASGKQTPNFLREESYADLYFRLRSS